MTLHHESSFGPTNKLDDALTPTEETAHNESPDAPWRQVFLRESAAETPQPAHGPPLEFPDNDSAMFRHHSGAPEGLGVDVLKMFEIKVLGQNDWLGIRNHAAILDFDHAVGQRCRVTGGIRKQMIRVALRASLLRLRWSWPRVSGIQNSAGSAE